MRLESERNSFSIRCIPKIAKKSRLSAAACATAVLVVALLAALSPTPSDAWVDPDTSPYLLFGGPAIDIGEAIAVAPDGSVLVAGKFESATIATGSTVLENQKANTADIVVVAMSPAGDVRWARSIGSPRVDSSDSLAIDASGNAYLAGRVNSGSGANGVTVTVSALPQVNDVASTTFTVDDEAAFVAKFSPEGSLLWVTTIDGTEDERAFAVAVTGDTVLVGGKTSSSTTTVSATSGPASAITGTSFGDVDGFVAALDATGVPLWTTRIGGTGADEVYDLAVVSASRPVVALARIDGQATVAGTWVTASIPVDSGQGGTDVVVMSLDDNGTPASSGPWFQRIGGPGSDEPEAMASNDTSIRVAATIRGPGTVAASTPYTSISTLALPADMLLARFASDLSFDASATNPSVIGTLRYSEPRAITITPDGGDLTTGFYDAPNTIGQRFAIVKRSADGTLEWIRTIGDAARSVGQAVAVDTLGNIYLTGRFPGGDIDPSPTATMNVAAAGGSDILVLRLDCHGRLGPPCTAPSVPPPPPPPPAITTAAPERIVTSSPAETAVSLSEEFFGAGADVVYVANGSSGVDGLTVGTSAGFVTGPLLLSETDRLPEATMTELRRLAPSRIVVIGGTAAISTSVTDALTPLGAAIERVGGANRYETAALLSRLTAPDGADTVYVTTGQGGADALAAASVAGGTGSPVLLTRRDDVPGVTRDELVRLRPRRVIVVGGAAAVSGEVLTNLAQAVPSATVSRAAGADRFDTSVEISRLTVTAPTEVAFLVPGSNVRSASGAPATGAGPVLLTRDDCIPARVDAELTRLRPQRVIVLGSPEMRTVCGP